MLFDENFVASVIEHMNSDHADACLCIAQTFGSQPTASHATLIDFNNVALQFSVSVDGRSITTEAAFPKPLRQVSQIRGALVAMTKSARENLAKRDET